ncbi:MAG TPA: circadian clock KaiB family protein [Gemmatimonas sp.]|nr:circadian clock KaiB family protein [Gemmatimonas sp.]
MDAAPDDTAAFDRLLADRQHEQYVLTLFVSGMSPRSTAALRSLKALCEEFLKGRYTLEVIDIYERPDVVATHSIIASPTLLRLQPLPVRRLIGDLTDRAIVMRTLELN